MTVYARLHSYYSLLKAVPSPAELVAEVSRAGYQTAVLTDDLSLSGAVSFYRSCLEYKLQPVIGVSIPCCDSPAGALVPREDPPPAAVLSGNLTFLVKNETGWKNLSRLLSAVKMMDPAHWLTFAGLSWLHSYSEGLFCLTGGMEGPFYALLRDGKISLAQDLIIQLRQCFGDRLFYEIHHQAPYAGDVVKQQIAFARQHNLPLLAAHIQRVIKPEQAALLRTLHAIRLNTDINKAPPSLLHEDDMVFLPLEKFQARFADIPEALENWQKICHSCTFELLDKQYHFPVLKLPEGKTTQRLLREVAQQGLLKKYPILTESIQQRLDYELDVIHQKGFESIFLIVQDILQFARREGIVTSSRGSAASSLVAYCLGITSPDPIKERLYFERFLNPERSSPPDIDTDICSRGREKIITYLFDTYGEDYVAVVGTINRLQPRSAVGSVAKAFGYSSERIRMLTKRFPHRFMAHLGGTSTSWQKTFAEAIQQSRDPVEQKILRQAVQLVDLPDHLSQHAGGVVITPFPVAERVPIQSSGSKSITITQFDHHDVEAMGLVKMDMLGIRGLTVLSDVAAQLFTWRRKEFDNSLAVLDAIPEEDEATQAVVQAGDTIGCFQIESPGMRSTLKEIGCKSIEGIMQALALYRPGPLQGGLHQSFIARYQGKEPVVDLHPALSEILADSYGVILYQEQVLRIAHEIGGLSLAEADILRRAMSHFDPGKAMQTLKEKFILGVANRHQMTQETAESIWQMMSAFAGYGFPKAHAASYARVAWESAWCKAHHPAEFLCAVLANWGGYYGQQVYINEARRKGIPIFGPHLHASENEFTTRFPQGVPTLYMGFNQIQRLSSKTIERILVLRPFSSFDHFLMQINPARQELENLIQVGALNLYGNIPTLLHQMEGQSNRHQQYTLGLEQKTDLPDWTIQQKIAAQQKLLGINMLCHPLTLVEEQAARLGCVSIRSAKSSPVENIRLAVLRQTWRRIRSQKKEMMAFVTLEDQTDMVDAILFPAAYQRCQDVISSEEPFWVEGKFDQDTARGDVVFLIEKAGKL
jgi:DNA-directed DNA polymerase III PolC